MYDFTPASDPISAVWSPGAFSFEVPLPRDEVVARLSGAVRPYRPFFQSRLTSTMTGIVADDRFRIWRPTYWRSQPNAGALVMDARLEDRGATTYVRGKVRRGYPFIPQALLWPAVATWWLSARVTGFGPFLVLITVIAVVQIGYAALTGRRDATTLLDFAALLLADRSYPRTVPYPQGIPDPASEFAVRYREPGPPEGG